MYSKAEQCGHKGMSVEEFKALKKKKKADRFNIVSGEQILCSVRTKLQAMTKKCEYLEQGIKVEIKRIKKNKPKSLDKQCEDLWRKIALHNAGYRCEYCYSTNALNVHHIFSRGRRTTKFDLENAICLCSNHHTLGKFSAHKSPDDFKIWLNGYRGKENIESLRLRSMSNNKVDLNLLLMFLKQEAKDRGIKI